MRKTNLTINKPVHICMKLEITTAAMDEWRAKAAKNRDNRIVEIRVSIDGVEQEFTLEEFKERLEF